MKKVFLSLLLASLVMVSFQSCNDEDDNPKGGKTELTLKGNILISPHVQGFDESATACAYAIYDDEKTEGRELLGESKIKNNKFKIKLKKPSDKVLMSYFTDEIPDKVTISDKNVKTTTIPGLIVKQQGDDYGQLIYSNTDFMTASIEAQQTGVMKINAIVYVYADRSADISGTYTEDDDDEVTNYTVNLQLKKGWNIIQLHTEIKDDAENKTEMTTISSVTSDYKWVFIKG